MAQLALMCLAVLGRTLGHPWLSMGVAQGWSLTVCPVSRCSASRRSGGTSPLGFARASPSPPSHADGAILARKLSLGGGRPFTPSPQGECSLSLEGGVSSETPVSAHRDCKPCLSPSGNHP